jgi:hypothetical protein
MKAMTENKDDAQEKERNEYARQRVEDIANTHLGWLGVRLGFQLR